MKKVLLLIIYILQLQLTVDAQSLCLDSTFAQDGVKDILPIWKRKSITLLKNGNILYSVYDEGFKLEQLTSSGDMNLSFGNHGTVDYPMINNVAQFFYEKEDNRILMCMMYDITEELLMQILPDGNVDSSFGTNGVASVNKDIDSSGIVINKKIKFEAHAMAVHHDGKIIVGHAQSGGHGDSIILVRFNANGTMDKTFGSFGFLSIYNGNYGGILTNIHIDKNNNIILSGNGHNEFGLRAFMIIKLLNDGSYDSSFGLNGKMYTNFGLDGLLYSYSSTLLHDDKIIITGSVGNGIIARFDKNGNLDNSFGDFGILNLNDTIIPNYILKIESDTYIGVNVGKFGNTDYGLIKVDDLGNIDTNFCQNGIFRFKITNSTENKVRNLFLSNEFVYLFGETWIPNGGIEDWHDVILKLQILKPDVENICRTVFPNPVHDILYFKSNIKVNINIYDNLGRAIVTNRTVEGKMDVSMLASGMYYLNVENNKDGTVCTYKFVKQ